MGISKEFKPKIIGFLCNWCCYGGADLCGVSRFQYPPYLRVIRVMCSGRVDPKFLFRALSKGADAVFVGGCHLNDCHYNTEGNYDALLMTKICKNILDRIGINPQRLRLEWVSAGEGIRFAEIMNEYSQIVRQLGPLGSSEGLSQEDLQWGLEAAARILPYIKLVEREKIRIPQRTEEAYNAYVASEALERLFDETIAPQLTISRILTLLQETPLTTAEIAERLRLSPSEVSRFLNQSSKMGWVRFDQQQKQYTAAL